MEEKTSCNVCKQPIQISWNYCPNCGNTLREKPLSTSLGKQLLIYSISFLLPPFGLGYAFKYLKQDGAKSKAVGVISIGLTILSILVIIISFKSFMDYYSKILNSMGSGLYPN
ncbi:hypothetical protein A2954_01725 [Candidatus Roizmanbacteria bacterium RIFCSPLOWO2_01_FULL_37_12]|uniref:Putative zinc-ribbon domain-containing protein n=1 Tax=Candidatus Roizmanbacteria bacterium RIFCSPLOWO2_01_FULL_37_12 TaxID=1802056 RepID=A0A1F7I9C0_9BACT|nr:MAG: hypothetical protein A2768_01025 [Candidatus Roizmanbacteria bacterium RIFCSPHIGHO2_01_FULL_37_16]OGK23106.1 MAG: hypothetical protein A3D76_05870 [Candidatus Roizmanbacteria bacterium RIFCSPHIGHO2_02_FULL_37_9b]OGK39967.1 MAG: hypothetical protein A2954_01725 [Candidatus Roizmanbacteria bacterium RIFCSPLOWO2_01_FULL_37_12]